MTSLLTATWLVLICGVIPVLAWISKRKIDQGLRLPRRAIYAEALVLQIGLFVLAAALAWYLGIPLFRRVLPDRFDLLLAAGILALALTAAIVGWRFASPEAKERIRMLLPSTRAERMAWILVSAAAAIGEETVYRGLLPRLLESSSGSFALAIAVSVIAFSLAHLIQGWTSAAIVGLFALGFHAMVTLSGALWTAIAVHFLYDLLAGLILGRVIDPRETIHAEV
jgi:membrane protease YdiL (CAAX protease family)